MPRRILSEREEAQQQKEFESRNSDRINNDNYWGNLEYHAVVSCSKQEEEDYLREELEDLRKLKQQFPKRLI